MTDDQDRGEIASDVVVDAITGMLKADGGKPRTELLPTLPLIDIAQVLTFGAHKYADHNWRKGTIWSRLYGAALRHLFAWERGEDTDPESGLPHLAHALCCIMFLQEYSHSGAGRDDRYRVEDWRQGLYQGLAEEEEG